MLKASARDPADRYESSGSGARRGAAVSGGNPRAVRQEAARDAVVVPARGRTGRRPIGWILALVALGAIEAG